MPKKHTIQDVEEYDRGSERIEEMRRVIKRCINGLAARLKKCDVTRRKGHKCDSETRTRKVRSFSFPPWGEIVLWTEHLDPLGPYSITRYKLRAFRKGEQVGDTTDPVDTIPMELVQDVFERLPEIHDVILEYCPEIQEHFNVLVRAART